MIARLIPPPIPKSRTPPPLPVDRVRVRRDWKYLTPAELKKLKNLFFAARIIVEGAYSGKHKSSYKGSSPEFVDYREYNPGDEIRTIDWKAYAKTDRYFIKLFEKETDMNCYVLLDRSASMAYGGKSENSFFPEPEDSKLDYAFYLAAALIYLMVKQGDKVSLTLFDEKVRAHVPPGGTFPHLYKILSILEKQKAGGKTSVARVLRDAFPLCQRKGLIILISDLLDEPSEIFSALNMYRHRNFEIILMHVLHKYEYRLPPLDNVKFIDSETGESISSKPSEIREVYDAEIREYIRTIASYASARKIDYHLITTDTPYSVALQKYLLRRGSR